MFSAAFLYLFPQRVYVALLGIFFIWKSRTSEKQYPGEKNVQILSPEYIEYIHTLL